MTHYRTEEIGRSITNQITKALDFKKSYMRKNQTLLTKIIFPKNKTNFSLNDKISAAEPVKRKPYLTLGFKSELKCKKNT
ncbi:hypothetical protein HanXRQr2_Chr05g0218801 [Helianthus annuus]|uniref:Uncharacterized protein n=1 Tax=Helianthus annuus TaxID=4232 RepID=A0A9K3J0T5_HELAN|nr:hypothetical protein HanXRQr2_Chr05g0218801 [Helianthus annuus]KAJ0570518.1 hypothetical protein HanHA300_Chr05g0178921 [Helianthus annuus]KAJ0584865.1 hypothetical protein HanHA89_Chr05g0193661 [Helianthus annuus]KAJ0923060.1 hypothetical protein HanPSC8_Chr05g0211221 [Helianthus annuus]